ncbi:hypothetical protein HMPREF0653_01370 [Prevotella disiens JCM 6334 = ATCC 29426]|uniref:Uncharacterized protein n=1 Tax=Prevotella disiens JCM 6334 = ATCC 29426 TaxID=1235811 RepID=A0ABN0NS24_9BACT|nr:hypothetical protein HMPREF0653_01370 [Prevotella disiens JCM 6334 = ATCC 29426]
MLGAKLCQCTYEAYQLLNRIYCFIVLLYSIYFTNINVSSYIA